MSTATRFDPRRKSTWRAYVPGPGALRDIARLDASMRAYERQSERLREIAAQLRALVEELDETITLRQDGPIVPRVRQVWVHALAAQLAIAARYADKIARSHRHLVAR